MQHASGEKHAKDHHGDELVAKIRKQHMAYINGKDYRK